MIYILLYLLVALVYGLHCFAQEMRRVSIFILDEYFFSIVFIASFEGVMFPLFLVAEIIPILKKDLSYIRTLKE